MENGNIVAQKQKLQGRQYTSARIKTQGLFSVQYGRIETRAKLPQGEGIWPAFWMLGSDIEENPWPKCGEIDIMEYVGKYPNKIFGALHATSYDIVNQCDFSEQFHDQFNVYAVEWDNKKIRFFFNDVKYATIKKQKNQEWAFDHKFFLILNLAIGGTFPGPPNKNTPFPAEFIIDYVRVYQQGKNVDNSQK